MTFINSTLHRSKIVLIAVVLQLSQFPEASQLPQLPQADLTLLGSLNGMSSPTDLPEVGNLELTVDGNINAGLPSVENLTKRKLLTTESVDVADAVDATDAADGFFDKITKVTKVFSDFLKPTTSAGTTKLISMRPMSSSTGSTWGPWNTRLSSTGAAPMYKWIPPSTSLKFRLSAKSSTGTNRPRLPQKVGSKRKLGSTGMSAQSQLMKGFRLTFLPSVRRSVLYASTAVSGPRTIGYSYVQVPQHTVPIKFGSVVASSTGVAYWPKPYSFTEQRISALTAGQRYMQLLDIAHPMSAKLASSDAARPMFRFKSRKSNLKHH